WLRRIAPWVPGAELWKAAGQMQLSASGGYSLAGLEVKHLRLVAQPLQFSGAGLLINEPSGRIEGSAIWQFLNCRFEVPSALIDTSALSAQAKDVAIDWSNPQALTVRGNINYQGEVARLAYWFGNAGSSEWQ